MDTLAKLFGSKAIVRILRLFILNPEEHFEASDVAERTKTDRTIVRQELTMLERIGFIKQRSFYKEVEQTRGKRVTQSRKRASGFIVDENFMHLQALRMLVAGNGMVDEGELTKKLAKAGRLKLVVLSGIFAGDMNSRIDLLIVGERLNRTKLENIIRDFEAEVGKEIKYGIFSTDDFRYRLSMQDRLLRDTFDFPHSTIIDRLGFDQRVVLA